LPESPNILLKAKEGTVPLSDSIELERHRLARSTCPATRRGLIGLPMPKPASINPRIVESLYCDALVLSDEVRAAFNFSGRIDEVGEEADLARIALSSEGLRTTTRMMHAIAWLLNLRAYFMGELSELQLRRHGRLSPDLQESEPEQMELLDADVRELVVETQRFYERLIRLDRGWRQPDAGLPSAVERLRQTFEMRAGR